MISGIFAAERRASPGDPANGDSDDEHQEGSYGQGLPPWEALPPHKRLMEEQDHSGENADSRADERGDHREGRRGIVNLRSQFGCKVDLEKVGLGVQDGRAGLHGFGIAPALPCRAE